METSSVFQKLKIILITLFVSLGVSELSFLILTAYLLEIGLILGFITILVIVIISLVKITNNIKDNLLAKILYGLLYIIVFISVFLGITGLLWNSKIYQNFFNNLPGETNSRSGLE